MQRVFRSLAVLATGVFLACLPFAVLAQATEEIRSFASDITVLSDGRITVSERIEYVFPDQRHGIYRDIPTRYVDEKGRKSVIPIVVDNVVNADGAPWQYQVQKNADSVRIKIGDPNATISGTQVYVISYSASGALRYFDDHDELYWNVTGTGWTVPIRRSSATIRLPENVPGDKLQLKCFTGAQGSTAQNCLGNRNGSNAEFVANDALTVVVGWPPGLVAKLEPQHPSPFAKAWPALIPLLTLTWLVRRWWTQGKDPRGTGTLVVQYDPPDNITPAEMGVLIDESADLTDVSATIVDLAVRGFIKIKEVETTGLLFKGKDFQFELRKPFVTDTALKAHERKVLSTIFVGDKAGQTVMLSTLKGGHAFYTAMPSIKKALYDQVVERGYFASNPELVRGKYAGIGVVIIIVAAMGISFGGIRLGAELTTALTIAVIVSGVLFLVFAPFMPKKTEKGKAAKEHAVGFSEYLEKAEKYRLQWQEKENMFEKFLPFAMVFGVVGQWSNAFKDIGLKAPDWYEGSSMSSGMFNAIAFGHMVNSMNSSVNAAMMSAPQKTSSGSGFSSGGGFSGGGGGGGGGGSW